ncbi:hypothetical protein [Actinokineospora sp. NBRC 105648]|uniref:hypothetical protein n=1 Tax=Actinokineospora sp. NBRC 105648 TaxID=3032206 RepID=UPI0024A3B4D9|nr:hypothetical protein [Actinokineospora sp. NBRC 105648]GLZ39916.1 hypothetical protein Acsp05_35400 [Actinokineospora sp. NBRC 105648]
MQTTRSRATRLAGGVLLVPLVFTPTTAAAAVPHDAVRLVELAPLPGDGTTFARDINDDGVIVGYSAEPGSLSPRRAVRWDVAGNPTDLGTLGGAVSTAMSVSANGLIAGSGQLANGAYHAVRWDRHGRITDLGALAGGTTSGASDVAVDGTVVGSAIGPDGHGHAVKWDPRGHVIELPSPPGTEASWAGMVNSRGDVLGGATTHLGVITALRWDRDGTLTVLPDLGVNPSYGWGLAHDGTAVGQVDAYPVLWTRSGALVRLSGQRGNASAVGADGTVVGYVDDHAVRWDRRGKMTTLDTPPGGGMSWGRGVNTRRYTVGNTVRVDLGVGRAVRWDPDGRAVELTSPADAGDGGADKINDRGMIIGAFARLTGGARAVLWLRDGGTRRRPMTGARQSGGRSPRRLRGGRTFLCGSWWVHLNAGSGTACRSRCRRRSRCGLTPEVDRGLSRAR